MITSSRAVWIGVACLVIAAISFSAGLKVGLPRSPAPPSPDSISEAQKALIYGLEPNWIKLSGEALLFEEVRNRAYLFCYRGKMIDRTCAAEQDQAIRDAVSAINVATAQQQMAEKDRLGLKEHWVAEHPEIISHVRSYCWNLYKIHGSSDARLLAICLGNLTDFSPLVPLPVP